MSTQIIVFIHHCRWLPRYDYGQRLYRTQCRAAPLSVLSRFILVGRLGIQSKVRYDLKLSRVEETTSCARRQTISFQSD